MSKNDDELKELKEKIFDKIAALMQSGKITDATPDAYFKKRDRELRIKMPKINDFGVLSEIAKSIGVTVGNKDTVMPAMTEIMVGDLVNRVDDHDNDVISVKGKVISAKIDVRPKKKNGEIVEGEFWRIAKLEIADETGVAMFSHFYDANFDDFFKEIEDGSINGKILHLMNVKIERSKYTGHAVQVSLKRNGGMEFVEGDIDASDVKVKTIPVNSASDGTKHFFLVRVVEKRIKKKQSGSDFLSLLCVDEESSMVDLAMWFNSALSMSVHKDDVILVEGDVKSREYGGKIYKSINVNQEDQVQVNPEGYDMVIRGQQVEQKELINVSIGDLIETKVYVKKIFGASQPYYNSCPVIVDITTGKKCGKSVKANESAGAGSWKCNGDHTLTDDERASCNQVAIMSGHVTSNGVTIPFKIFDRGNERNDEPEGEGVSIVQKLTGDSIAVMVNKYRDLGDELFYQRLNQNVTNRLFKIIARVVLDDYRGNIALQLRDISEVNLQLETAALKERLRVAI